MEYIINKRLEFQTQIYLVKWIGKQHSQNSWLTRQSICSSERGQQLMKDFELNQKNNLADPLFKRKKNKGKRKIIAKENKRTIMIQKLKIAIPCKSKQKCHWIFGHKVKEIIKSNDSENTYEVNWINGYRTTQIQQDLIQKQSTVLCLFLEKELKLNI